MEKNLFNMGEFLRWLVQGISFSFHKRIKKYGRMISDGR